MKSISWTLDSKKTVSWTFFFLISLSLIFFLLDIVINYNQLTTLPSIRRLFNLAREDSLAAWFASTQTLLTGFLLFLNYFKTCQMTPIRWRRWGWFFLATFFVYLAIDDGAAIHERVGTALEHWRERQPESQSVLDHFPSYSWQIVFGPIFFAIGIFIVVFLWRELTSWRSKGLIFLALSCYVLAEGLDFIEGLDGAYVVIAQKLWQTRDFVSHFARDIEEFLELIGTSFFFLAFLNRFFEGTSEFQVKINKSQNP